MLGDKTSSTSSRETRCVKRTTVSYVLCCGASPGWTRVRRVAQTDAGSSRCRSASRSAAAGRAGSTSSHRQRTPPLAGKAPQLHHPRTQGHPHAGVHPGPSLSPVLRQPMNEHGRNNELARLKFTGNFNSTRTSVSYHHQLASYR